MEQTIFLVSLPTKHFTHSPYVTSPHQVSLELRTADRKANEWQPNFTGEQSERRLRKGYFGLHRF